MHIYSFLFNKYFFIDILCVIINNLNFRSQIMLLNFVIVLWEKVRLRKLKFIPNYQKVMESEAENKAPTAY